MPVITLKPGGTGSRVRALGRVAAFWAGHTMLLVFGGKLSGFAPPAGRLFVSAIVIGAGTLGLTLWLLKKDGRPAAEAGVAPDRGSAARLALGFGFGLGLVALNATIAFVFGHVRWERVAEMGSGAVLLSLALFLLLSCAEELSFRGYPLRRLEGPFGLWGAQFIVAGMFGLYHFFLGWPLLHAFVGTGLGSLLFGMAALATRGLALPIGLHAAWNLGDWLLGGKGEPGLWRMVVAEEFRARSQLGGLLCYCTVMIAATGAFWLWHRRLLAIATNPNPGKSSDAGFDRSAHQSRHSLAGPSPPP